MTIGTLLKAALINDTGVAAIVHSRNYPNKLPQHPTYPANTYQRISNSPQNGSTSLRSSRWQISCWAETYGEVQELAAAVKALMEEYTDTAQTPGIKMAEVVNEIDDFDSEAGEDDKVQRVIIDVMLTTTGD